MRFCILLVSVGILFFAGTTSAQPEDPNCKDDAACVNVTPADCQDPDLGPSITKKCPKTCDACYKTTTSAADANCVDDAKCQLVDPADCVDPDLGPSISKKCPKTCNACPTVSPCEDLTLVNCTAQINSCQTAAIMKKYCEKTCGFCGGVTPAPCHDDPTADCAAKKSLCTNPQYKDLMTKYCPLTCGFCR